MVLRTFNEELDRRISGIPLPSLVLIEGPNDSGKSVLLYHLIYGCVRLGRRVCLFSSEGGGRVLIESMRNLGLDATRHYLSGDLVVIPFGLDQLEVSQETLKRFLGRLLAYFRSKGDRYALYAVDSLTVLITGLQEKDTLAFFSDVRELRERGGLSFVFTVHPYSFSQDFMVRLRSMADVHLSLNIREVSGQILKTLQVLKVRGASKATGDVITFEVEPGFGIKVLPYTQVRV
ncbi:MAG: ATPase domain-containing protein [Candidatus Caldarchaeales archaeon]